MDGLTLAVMAAACLIAQGTALFVPATPVWLHWVGQLAMPLCVFLVGWGFEHAGNRTDFLIRLHMASVVTAIVQTLLHVDVNPFPVLVQIALIIALLSLRNRLRRVIALAAYALWQVMWFVLLNEAFSFHAFPVLYDYRHLVTAFFALVPTQGHRVCCIILGILLWRFRRSPAVIASVMTVCSLLALVMVNTRLGLGVLYLPYRTGAADPAIVSPTETAWSIALQYLGFDPFAMGSAPFGPRSPWMMVFALPFMLAYDRRRGAYGTTGRIPHL